MSNNFAIETSQLSKSYGNFEAVQGIDLAVRPGQITAFLGLNGAGKSTTIKMLLGLVKASGGEARVLGEQINDKSANVRMRRRVGYVSESKQLYDYMTVSQLIRFTKSFYADWRSDIEQKLIASFGLPANRIVKSLSKGMRTKLALLLVLARNPELLILDEPSEGLDPFAVEQMLESLVTQCGRGTTVFFSSHQINEVERIADQVCILHKGRLLMDASLDHVRESYRHIDLVFTVPPDESSFRLPGVERIETSGCQMNIVVGHNADMVVERARELRATSVQMSPIGLREIFLGKVKEDKNALV